MKKIVFAFILLSGVSHAQTGNVGINTTTPAATLDVTGVATDPAKLDGVIAPRLTGDQLAAKTYTTAQTGAIVYATAAAASLTGQVINVASAGYYYFDGTVWQNMSGLNPDVKFIGANNHVSQDAGVGGAGTDAGTGFDNVLIGDRAGNTMTTGFRNVGVGFLSLRDNTTGYQNVAIGSASLPANTTGILNVAIGGGMSMNTTGSSNVAVGNAALTFNTTNSNSTAIGAFALNKMVGANNTALGFEAGHPNTGAITAAGTGANNTFLGYRAGRTVNDGSNNIMIGANTTPNIGVNSSNQLNIGNWIYGNGGLIGLGAAAASPTERLDVAAGNVRVRDINTNVGNGTTDRVVVADTNGVLKTLDFGSYTLFHARLAANQNIANSTITPLLLATPLATSPLYTYNTGTGVMTFNQAGNYLVTMQASFTNIPAGTQLLMGIRPFPDGPYLGRGSRYNAVANSGTIGELMNYTTMIIVPSAGYQVRFVVAPNSNATVLSIETGGTGSGNVTNVTVQKI